MGPRTHKAQTGEISRAIEIGKFGISPANFYFLFHPIVKELKSLPLYRFLC
jgi:hypothetical protein